MSKTTLPFFLALSFCATIWGQSIPVADQTLPVSGEHLFYYAFAEGDQVSLHFEMVAGGKMKELEFVEFPGQALFLAHETDSILEKTLLVPRTGVYRLRFSETGLRKKICRFIIQRTPGSPEMAHFDTRINWDVAAQPRFVLKKRSLPAGKKTELVSLAGQINVPAFKLGSADPAVSWQFSLPPNTVRWAYRIAVGQTLADARRRDAELLTQSIKKNSLKLLGYEANTALAAYALGLAVDLAAPKGGEDVEYALSDEANAQKFRAKKGCQTFVRQKNVSSDVQRRTEPLAGNWYFSFRNDNWLDDVSVSIEIEAVTETAVIAEAYFLEAE